MVSRRNIKMTEPFGHSDVMAECRPGARLDRPVETNY